MSEIKNPLRKDEDNFSSGLIDLSADGILIVATIVVVLAIILTIVS